MDRLRMGWKSDRQRLEGRMDMRRFPFCGFGVLAVCVLSFMSTRASGKNAADYPLRVHVFQFNSHSHYYQRSLETVDGEGRANLYQNGEPRGFDFSYQCGERIRMSPGYETYPARWKKQGQSLEILLPVMGIPEHMDHAR